LELALIVRLSSVWLLELSVMRWLLPVRFQAWPDKSNPRAIVTLRVLREIQICAGKGQVIQRAVD